MITPERIAYAIGVASGAIALWALATLFGWLQ